MSLFLSSSLMFTTSCITRTLNFQAMIANISSSIVMFCRVDDAIEILEYVVGMREEKLGTANPDVDDEKRRLEELLKESGRARNRRSRRSLETLLDTHSQLVKNNGIKVL